MRRHYMTELTTICPINFAKEFPALPEPLITRDPNLDMIDRLFEDHSLVFLEADSGFGTTIMAAQYCLRHAERSFGLFIKPASRIAYSMDYLRLVLSEQFYFFITGSSLSADVVSPGDFNKYRLQLRKRASQSNPLYFVIDGLHQISKSETKACKEILHELLPFGWDGFRFLIVGSQSDFQKHIPVIQGKPAYALPFVPQESSRFLTEAHLPENEVIEIHQMCRGIPGRLAAVRRLILGGLSLSGILNMDGADELEFVRLEFEPVSRLSQTQKELVALFSYSGRKLTLKESCDILGATDETVHGLLSTCTFLEKNASDIIEFVSEAHRQYAGRTLEKEKSFVLEAQITHLLKNPTSSVAMNFLPTYYQQLDQTLELVRLLNADHFSHLLDETASLGSLKARAELGLQSAISARLANETFSFTLKGNLFSSIASAKGSASEVRALVALGDVNAALDLADRSLIKEERLAFLASYAKECLVSKLRVSPDLLSRITEEASKIDFSNMGDAAVAIATDLLTVDQSLAMSIVETARNSKSRNPKKLSPVSSLSSSAGSGTGDSQESSEGSRISDEVLFSYYSAFADLVSETSAKEALDISSNMEAQKNLEFLAIWLTRNAKTEKASDVAEQALDIMIGLTTYTPRMSDLSAFSSPLPHVTEKERGQKLVSRFDAQRSIIKDTSISKASVELQLRLAHGECLYDKDSAGERIINVYYEIQDIEPLDTRIDCLAEMLKGLTNIENANDIPSIADMGEMCAKELTQLIDTILADTAEHLLIVRNALKSLATFNIEAAKSVASKLNLLVRRDQAYGLIARELCSDVPTEEDVESIVSLYRLINDSTTRSVMIELCLKSICMRKYKLSFDSIKELSSLFELITVPELRSSTYVWLCGIVTHARLHYLLPDIFKQFDASLQSTIAPSQKITCCFHMSWVLASERSDEAKNYFAMARCFQSEIEIVRNDHVQSLAYCCGLATRALAWLSVSSNLDDSILSRFDRLVRLIPPLEIQMELMADLTCRLYLKGNGDLARKIAIDYCQDMISEESSKENPRLHQMIIASFAATFLVHSKELALEQLHTLPCDLRNQPLARAIDCILSRRSWVDPNSPESRARYAITYADALDVCTLIEELKGDSEIYFFTKRLCQAITHKINALNFTAQQKANVATRLSEIYKKSLPDKNNIAHQGYVVICEAAVLTLAEKSTHAEWKSIEQAALCIPNVADRSYVLGELVYLLPGRFSGIQKFCREQSYSLSLSIPSLIDQIGRLLFISDNPAPEAVAQAKTALRTAIGLTFNTINENLARARRREIIDAAAKIDEKFAHELVELIDEDPARKSARREIDDQLNLIQTRKKLINAKSENDRLNEREVASMSGAAWDSLESLLSGRIVSKELNVMGSILKQMSLFPLENAFPVLAWYIENVGVKYASSSHGDSYIRPLVESLLTTTDLATSLIQRVDSSVTRSLEIIEEQSYESGVIGLTNRSSALTMMADWLRSTKGDIVLCDPYFSPKDVDFLSLILANLPETVVTILTSRSHLENENALSEEKFLTSWRGIKDQDPPITRIIAVSHADSLKTPLHDRWLLSEEKGLRLGTSFSSIGTGKLSEISKLDNSQYSSVANSLIKFVNQQPIIDGVKIKYFSFSL